MQAFFVNKIGDIFFTIGFIVILYLFKQSDYSFILYNFNSLSHSDIILFFTSLFFLVIAFFVKSSQIGFHVWLLDAMEGPTQVSSLLHAATMVTAGVICY